MATRTATSKRPLARGERSRRFELIEQVVQNYPEAACKAIGIHRSGYYACRKKPERADRKGELELRPKIREVLNRSRGV